MSDFYQLICIDHDPAIPVPGVEWTDPDTAIADVQNRFWDHLEIAPTDSHPMASHLRCALVVAHFDQERSIVRVFYPWKWPETGESGWVSAARLRELLGRYGNFSSASSIWLVGRLRYML